MQSVDKLGATNCMGHPAINQARPVPAVSIIVPVFNEVAQLDRLIAAANDWKADELFFVDGGSDDGTVNSLEQAFSGRDDVQVLSTTAGRAHQMQYGAERIRCPWALFVHADTLLPTNFRDALVASERTACGWGRFNLEFERGSSIYLNRAMRVIAAFINFRSRLTRIATGDQALFVRAELLKRVGGIPIQPIMEDIELCKRLKPIAKHHASRLLVITSPRRWQQRGVVSTVLLMWFMRLAYFLGVPASGLAKLYANVR